MAADAAGMVQTTRTDVTVNNTDGSVTETLTDANTAGVVTDRLTTKTSADGHTVPSTVTAPGRDIPAGCNNA